MAGQAYSYLRVSGKGQVDGHGFDRQRDAIQSYARSQGIEVVREFRDEGVSGTTELSDRKGLAGLLDQLEADGVRLVLVERADRLARDLMVGEVILGQLRDLGVTVIEADGGTDLTAGNNDPTRVLIRQVLGAVAQFEKSVTVLKLRAARERIRREEGRCEGKKPFGAKEGEQVVLGWMIALRRKRPNGRPMTYEAIAQQLNLEGLPSRSGRPWIGQTVCGIIQRQRRRRSAGS